jgi:uncharacterized phiE125 gp8 family phage protein
MNDGYSYSVSLSSAPAIEPVTLAECKAFSRIDIPDDDSVITGFITSARAYVEAMTRRQLINATWVLYLDKFPATIELPYPPASSVTNIKYYDTAGTLQTLSASEYQTDFTTDPGRIMPAYSCVWPQIRDQTFKAVQVTYVAGYGATAALVPQAIRQAIMEKVDTMYWHRSQILVGTSVSRVPEVGDHLIWPYRCFGF